MSLGIRTPTPVDLCFRCGYAFDGARGDGAPMAGDFTICLSCGELLRYGPDLRTRPTTCEDVAVMTPSQVEGVRRAQAAIRAGKFRVTMPRERS